MKRIFITVLVLVAVSAGAADNFWPGYEWVSATGRHTGADFEDTISQAFFTKEAFLPGNTNALFDGISITGVLYGTTWKACLAQGGVAEGNISNSSVTSAKIVDGTITYNDIAAYAIDTTDSSTNYVSKIASNAVCWQSLNTNVQGSISNHPAWFLYIGATNGYSTMTTNNGGFLLAGSVYTSYPASVSLLWTNKNQFGPGVLPGYYQITAYVTTKSSSIGGYSLAVYVNDSLCGVTPPMVSTYHLQNLSYRECISDTFIVYMGATDVAKIRLSALNVVTLVDFKATIVRIGGGE